MLKKPADLDVLFKFATIATKTGDLEGAISALERMLLIDANLPRVRLELGVLYYRLGSFEVARTYLEDALKSPNLPPDVRSRAEQFMAQVQAQQKTSVFAAEAFIGLRYQSNANLGPATSNVQLFGQAANLNQQSLGPTGASSARCRCAGGITMWSVNQKGTTAAFVQINALAVGADSTPDLSITRTVGTGGSPNTVTATVIIRGLDGARCRVAAPSIFATIRCSSRPAQ